MSSAIRGSALLLLALLWGDVWPGALAPAAAEDEKIRIKAGPNELLLAFPTFEGLVREAETDEQLMAWWHGTIDKSEVLVEVRIYPGKEYYVKGPEDVADFAIYTYRDPSQRGDPAFAFQRRTLHKGRFGYIPLGAICTGLLPNASEPKGEVLMLGGMLEEHGYTVSFECRPALSGKSRARILSFLEKGVTAKSEVQDPKWSKKDVEQALKRLFPNEARRRKAKKPLRTKHFIVFTNASTGKLFAKKMEAFYKQIQKTFPFEEVPGRRLLPIYLYRLPEEYHDFCRRVAQYSQSEAEATKGHAWMDYYATYYESPNDPTHAHEATHQLFMNRLHLIGGGSWFQEGVAEYICTKPGERKAFAKPAARRGLHRPFREFVRSQQLISSGQDANEAYLQAASIIEFLRDGKFHPKRFPDFVKRMGLAPDNSVEAIEQILDELYGVDLDGLEAEWIKYWKGR